ncbi:TetR/AcrR family transcriptional regulator [Mycobacterium deserti]|uniref:TetR/AcrR family transcriptional regulator n=1 Tax=Mycobacterium deserti TaxID=2978347 RepID=A0ABT2M3S1_9MYCO|nr:TetR/AcrR family transcriptional regulator [Mycobacterium deserti]MCT7656909.1 TetR/AcrR family transcriptional regulator [Mycobacterium deserti]
MPEARLKRMPPYRMRRLVDVAAAEFAAFGYENASLNRIIEHCEMSKSSFYYVLSSKAELFDFVVQQLTEEVARHISIPPAEFFTGPLFWPKLHDFFDELIAASDHQPALTLGRVFYSGPAPETTAVNATLAAAHAWVAEVVQVGRDARAVRDDLPAALQVTLVFRMLQVFDEWTVQRIDEFRAEDLKALAGAQFAAIRRLLAP